MGLQRRTGNRFTANAWPGFVDAMTALLLVLMFVLSIFMIVQFVLSERISDQDSELSSLSGQVQALADALGLEQAQRQQLQQARDQLLLESERQNTLIATLRARSAELASRVVSFEAQVASMLAEQARLEEVAQASDAARQEAVDAQDALNVALAALREEQDAAKQEAARLAAEKEALEALTAELNASAAQKEAQLADLFAALTEKETVLAMTQTGLADEAARAAALEESLSQAQADLTAQEEAKLAQAAAAALLRERLEGLEQSLSEEEAKRLTETAAAEVLRQRLRDSTAELTAMSLALEEERKRAEDTLTLLAAVRAQNEALEDEKAHQAAEALSEQERLAALLSVARSAFLDEEASKLDALRQQEALNQQVAALRSQLSALEAILGESEAKEEAQRTQLTLLGQRLNAALARVAAESTRRLELEQAEIERLAAEALELENYRSEFFGQVRRLLEGRDGVRIVGDRFIFSSEVLFAPGEADLSASGQREIANIAQLLRDISDQIPSEIDWVLQVDGHTDNIPLSGFGEFSNNWELSQARALSVVLYMVNTLGLPPQRLSANGFGEHQPIATGNSAQARAQNRRIELKFTEK